MVVNLSVFFFFFQIYYYHNVKCRREMFDKDIVMLQVTTYTSLHFIKCLLTQALCTSAYPSSKPFNGKDFFFV